MTATPRVQHVTERLAVLASLAVLAVAMVSCEPSLVPRLSLSGLRLGITDSAVQAALGRPDSRIEEGDFAWWFYDKGIVVGLAAHRPDPSKVVWVVQTRGEYSRHVAVGDPVDTVVKSAGAGRSPSEMDGWIRLRYEDSGAILDFLFENGRLAAIALVSTEADPTVVPPPDPRMFPEFTVQGMRLLMTASEVVTLLGEPAERKPMSCWESWRYPALGVTVDLASVADPDSASSTPQETPRVIWVMRARLEGPPTAGSYHPPEGDKNSPRERTILTNDRGQKITFYYGSEEHIVAAVMSFEQEPINRRTEGIPSEVDPSTLAGLQLYMTADEAKGVLGEPDRAESGEGYSDWDYLEAGVEVKLFQTEDGVWKVGQVTQYRGVWSTVVIGDTQEEAERRLGRTAAPEGYDRPAGIRFDLADGSFMVTSISNGRVDYFRLSLPEGA